MPEPTSSVSETRLASTRVIQLGLAAIVAILVISAVLLFVNLPDADAFNAGITRDLRQRRRARPDATQMLEIMAETGTTFSGVLAATVR
jgi:hypothetical protein